MKTIVDRLYQNDYPEIIQWLQDNVGKVAVPKYGDYWAAEGWEAYHESVGKPSFVMLRVEFDRSEDAALYALRWL